MNTLEFFERILPEDGVYYLVLFPADKPQAKYHRSYTDLAQMALDVQRFDLDKRFTAVYHACGAYQSTHIEEEKDGQIKKRYRVDQNWLTAKALWVDVDCGQAKADADAGYATKQEALQAVLRATRALEWRTPLLVDSGNGLHAYWSFDRSVKAETWVKMARGFKAVLAHMGTRADPTRTADFASILRPVGSHNRKNNADKLVEVKHAGEIGNIKEMAESLKAFIHDHEVTMPRLSVAKPAQSMNSDLTGLLPVYPQVDCSGEQAAQHCLQLQHMRDTKGDCSYDTWRLLIGLLKHCTDGEELAREWSADREATGHDQTDWRTRWETWNAGPSTCQAIGMSNPSGCVGCTHKGKVTSPIQLGKVIPIAQPVVVEVKSEDNDIATEATVPEFPNGYVWQGAHMVRMVQDKEGVVQAYPFCRQLFYPITRISGEDGRARFGMRLHLPKGRVRDFDLSGAVLGSPTDMLRQLGDNEIMSSNHKDATTHMTAYLKDSLHNLMQRVEQVRTYANFGWKDDYKAFLIGDRLYKADGIEKVLLGGYAASKAAPFNKIKGNVDGYRKALDFIYARAGMEPLQYALCSGWGSVLTPFGDDLYRGVVFSLYGQSGVGKSTVAYNSLYAFGEATDMSLKSEQGFTELALWGRLGTYNNLPLLLDEMTNVAPELLSKLVYRVSLGEERERLRNTPNGTRFAESAKWSTSPFMTSNKDLIGLLATNLANAEAEGVRVVQLHMEDYNLPVYTGADLEDFQRACDQIRQNMGAPGHVMIHHCVKNVSAIRARIRDKMRFLSQHIPETKFRFYRSHAACTLVMGEVARELGVHSFDTEALERFSIELIRGLRATVESTNTSAPDAAWGRFIGDITPRLVRTLEYRDLRSERGPESPLHPVIGAPAGRYVLGSHFEKTYGGRMWIVWRDMRDWCMKNRVDMPVLLRYLSDRGALISERAKVNLTRGSTMPAMQVECVEIDTIKLDAQEVKASELGLTTGPNSTGTV